MFIARQSRPLGFKPRSAFERIQYGPVDIIIINLVSNTHSGLLVVGRNIVVVDTHPCSFALADSAGLPRLPRNSDCSALDSFQSSEHRPQSIVIAQHLRPKRRQPIVVAEYQCRIHRSAIGNALKANTGSHSPWDNSKEIEADRLYTPIPTSSCGPQHHASPSTSPPPGGDAQTVAHLCAKYRAP